MSRRPAAIRLGKLRAAGEVLELGPAELAFDFEQTRSFLRDRCDIDVAPREVAALLEASEGWVASLQRLTGWTRKPRIWKHNCGSGRSRLSYFRRSGALQ